jgi:hypothetical protein
MSTIAVAELAMSMMLNLVRGTHLANESMKKGLWEKKKFHGAELNGKTLGVVGFGRIGRAVAERAKAFGMSEGVAGAWLGGTIDTTGAVVAAGYSLTDELHQLFVPGRTSSVFDSGLDALGAILGMAALYAYVRLTQAKARSKAARTENPAET